MPNTETIRLHMTTREADSAAYVLMASLHEVSMLPRERREVTAIANELFKQLGYGHYTNVKGDRIENK